MIKLENIRNIIKESVNAIGIIDTLNSIKILHRSGSRFYETGRISVTQKTIRHLLTPINKHIGPSWDKYTRIAILICIKQVLIELVLSIKSNK